MPIGAITATADAWAGLIEAPFLHTSTFGGNQLACAAANAALNYIEKNDVLDRSAAAGAYFKKGWNQFKKIILRSSQRSAAAE